MRTTASWSLNTDRAQAESCPGKPSERTNSRVRRLSSPWKLRTLDVRLADPSYSNGKPRQSNGPQACTQTELVYRERHVVNLLLLVARMDMRTEAARQATPCALRTPIARSVLRATVLRMLDGARIREGAKVGTVCPQEATIELCHQS